jgi:hypothetical protein
VSFWKKGEKQPRSEKAREALKGKGAKYGRGLPVFSVETLEEARSLVVMTCSLAYDGRHTLFKPGVWGDFGDGGREVEDLNKVTTYFAKAYARLKKCTKKRKKDDTTDADPRQRAR